MACTTLSSVRLCAVLGYLHRYGRTGDKLQFETMFVQSNDWFSAFTGGGSERLNGDTGLAPYYLDRLRK